MTASDSRSPAEPTAPPSTSSAEARLGLVQLERDAETEPGRRAMLRYRAAQLTEEAIGNDALAVREYLAAFNDNPSLRPPLFALLRIFERRRSFVNLVRLYKAEAKSAIVPRERASALVDAGSLHEDQLSKPEDAPSLYRDALDADPSNLDAALMLERYGRSSGQTRLVERGLRVRAEHSQDASLRALLKVELAYDLERRGEVDEAFEWLRSAAEEPVVRWRTYEQMERMARKHGRTDELLQALEGLGHLARATLTGADEGQWSGLFSIERLPSPSDAKSLGAALYYENARIRLRHQGDAAAAAKAIGEGLALREGDLFLLEELVRAFERARDDEAAVAVTEMLLDHPAYKHPDSLPHTAALHFRLATYAQQRGDLTTTKSHLDQALVAQPSSPALLATLDDLLLDNVEHEERVRRLVREAEAAAGDDRAEALWQAGQITAELLNDVDSAGTLYLQAAEEASDAVPILRELYGMADRAGAVDLATTTLASLLEHSLQDDERVLLRHEQYALVRYARQGEEQARQLLERAIDQDDCASWAPHAARLFAAERQEWGLLSKAHDALANVAAEPESIAAHLCASARARLRDGDTDGSIVRLRNALAKTPGHRYGVALLEEVLQSKGAAEEVVTLLRESADYQSGSAQAEQNLLLAGAAAEASADPKLAAETYEEAADLDPTSLAPLYALRRLADVTGDKTLLLRALDALSERELASGEPGRATLELGEHYDRVARKSSLAEASYRAVLDHQNLGDDAAIALAALPGAAVEAISRFEAFERLAASVSDSEIAAIDRAAGAEAAAAGDAERTNALVTRVLEREPNDPWALWTRIGQQTGKPPLASERASSWLALARSTDDIEASAELALLGLRATLVAQGEDSADDAFLIGQEINASAPESPMAGVGLDETLGLSDDPDSRVEALTARLGQTRANDANPLEAELGWTLLAAGRTSQALQTLQRVVTKNPTDLASWEALRVAARAENRWELVSQACDRLALELEEGPLQAELLEESAAVLMDHLGDDSGARQRLSRVLASDPTRPIAYGRLHDLLAETGDTDAQQALVEKRLGAAEESGDAVPLLYEKARLSRADGRLEEALTTVTSLLRLDSQHVGGIALKAEVLVACERWMEAVETLRELAAADVPPAQKRLAHLGAATFLDKHLNDPAGAIQELERIETIGLSDAALHKRIADTASRAENYQRAVEAWAAAASMSQGEERAAFERLRAETLLNRLSDTGGAVTAYSNALTAFPADGEAADALYELQPETADRQSLSRRFEDAVRETIDQLRPEDIRKLRRAAIYRSNRELELVSLGTLVALSVASDEERASFRDCLRSQSRDPQGTLDDEALSRLRAPGSGGPLGELARLSMEAIMSADGVELTALGVGRSDLVSPKNPSPLRDGLNAIASTFGVSPGDLYVGGTDPHRIALLLGKRDRPTWVVGQAVAEQEVGPAERYRIGQLAVALREGTLPFVDRSPNEAISVLHALAASADTQFTAAATSTATDEVTRSIGKRLPRRSKRSFPGLIRAVDARSNALEKWVSATRMTGARAGLIVSADVPTAIAAFAGGGLGPDGLNDSDPTRDLLRFWISETSLRLRRGLGFDR